MTLSSNITVVIPALGNYNYTIGCLLSLMETSNLVDEIILIDNDIEAETAKRLIVNYPKVALYTPRYQMSVARSWDIGIKMAKNNLVAVVNNDIKSIVNGWDEKLVEIWKLHEDAAILCPWPIGGENEIRESLEDLYSGLNGSFFVVDREKLRLIDNYKTKGEYIDNNYEVAYWEDADLLVQVRNAGMESYVIPQIQVVHYGNKTAGPMLPSDKGMHNPYWINLAYFNHKYNVFIWDWFEVYMSNVLDERTRVRMI